MSVLLIEPKKNGKYEFTKEELQEILDKVEQEAFERGMSFGQKAQELTERKVGFYAPVLLNPVRDWDWGWRRNEVTCTSTNVGTDPMDIKQ